MAALLVSTSAVLICAHGGTGRPVRPSARVRLGGLPAVAAGVPCAVTGCALPQQAGGPCVSAQWITSALRVRLEGAPAVLADSRSVCTPTGTPLAVGPGQPRVTGG